MAWQIKSKFIEVYQRISRKPDLRNTLEVNVKRSDNSCLIRRRNIASFAIIDRKLRHSFAHRVNYCTRVWIFALLLLFLAGCNLPVKSSLPTPIPTEFIPTVVAMTLEAGKTIYPPLTVATQTNTAENTQEGLQATQTITPFPSETNTPVPQNPTSNMVSPTAVSYGDVFIPQAEIEIRTPGHLSKVTSPIPVYAILKPGYDRRVRVELFGEDHRVLARQIVSIPYLNKEGKGILSISINFEIPGTAENARLAISTEDEFGRMTALNSLPLILIAIGEPDIIPALDMRQSIFIQQPAPRTIIQGETLVVSGRAHPDGDEFVMIQLVGQDGKVVGKRICSLSAPDASDYGMFLIDVPFTVTESIPV